VALSAAGLLIAQFLVLSPGALAAEPAPVPISPATDTATAAPEDTEPRTAEEKELAWARAYGDAQDIGTALVAVAHAQVQAGEPQRGIGTLLEALGIASHMRDDGLALGAAMTMADAYHALREYDTAERWVERAHAHRDRLPGRFEALEAATAAARSEGPTEDAEPAAPAAPRPVDAAKSIPPTVVTAPPPPPLPRGGGPTRVAVPVNTDTLEQGMRSARWLLLLFVVLLAGLLWVMLRRGSKLSSDADRAAREQQLLASVTRTLREEARKGSSKGAP
jgi:hypothetical protein